MLVKSPKYRKGISSNQVRLLEVLFKFRFSSVPLISEYLGKDKSTIYERLLVLVEQGYVKKNYDSSYRLPPRPATYSLAAKGIKHLRDNNQAGRYSETALRNMYKNRSASVPLVDHSLDVFKLCLQFKAQYPDVFAIFSKSEMAQFDDFLRPLPDLYVQRKSKRSTKPNYFLETIEAGTMTWILKKRIQAHQEWLDEHEEDWGDSYPTLLFVCSNASTEKRIQRLATNGGMDFEIYTTTRKRLEADNTKIWLHDFDPDWDEEMELVKL